MTLQAIKMIETSYFGKLNNSNYVFSATGDVLFLVDQKIDIPDLNLR